MSRTVDGFRERDINEQLNEPWPLKRSAPCTEAHYGFASHSWTDDWIGREGAIKDSERAETGLSE